MTQEEIERETIRQMLIGSLAIELPEGAFAVLWDNYRRDKVKRPTGDHSTEQGA